MPLVDEDAAIQMKRIFEAIGFFAVAKVVKRRELLSLKWREADVEICLDDVVDVGKFVELELVVANQSEMKTAKQKLWALAEQIGLSGSIRTSYLEMLLKNRGKL